MNKFPVIQLSVIKFLVCIIGVTVGFSSALAAGGTHIYEIPKCPDGAVLKIYGPVLSYEKWYKNAPRIEGVSYVRDAKRYLQSQGIEFVSGGFAIYFEPTDTLVIATDKINHDQLTVVLGR